MIKRRKKKKAIRCTETWKRYESIEEAAIDNNVTVEEFEDYFSGKRDTCAGKHWIYCSAEFLICPL